MNPALLALTVGAFGIGVTEFVIMGLLLNVSQDLGVSIAAAGLLISGYALGVVIGAPILTGLTTRWSRKHILIGLMVIFTLGNLACAVAPNYGLLMTARVLTALAHGTFFGVGSIVATNLVPAHKRASAIAIMFTGLTVANIIGVPAGTWLGLLLGWRATFWAVSVIGILAVLALAVYLPRDTTHHLTTDWRADLKAMYQAPILLGLLTTALGFAGVFAVFTYIAPILTQISGFSEQAVSPILLVFGLGLIAGNFLGGKLADKKLVATLIGTLLTLSCVLFLMHFTMYDKLLAIIFVGILGAAAFATVPPLQMWVLNKSAGKGQSMASSLNIAAFNLGNAMGAWLGGTIISHDLGLSSIFWIAAILPLIGISIVGIQHIKNRKIHGRHLS